jgi:signal transduction histidine kinase
MKNQAEIIGKTDFDLFPEEIARANFNEELEILKTGKPVIAVEGVELWKDRPPTWVSSTKIPVRDVDGKIIGTFGISRDITSLKQKEAEISQENEALEKRIAERTRELIHKNNELEAFTYTVSHDLKAPLRGISGYSDLLLREHSSQLDDEGRSFLGKLIYSANQLGDLIDDLLAIPG